MWSISFAEINGQLFSEIAWRKRESDSSFCNTKTPEPTGSGTFLSFAAKILPNLSVPDLLPLKMHALGLASFTPTASTLRARLGSIL